jgi:hypothetical protein
MLDVMAWSVNFIRIFPVKLFELAIIQFGCSLRSMSDRAG